MNDQISIISLSKELDIPVEKLIEGIKSSGVDVDHENQNITHDQKTEIISHLEKIHHALEKEIKVAEKKEKDVFTTKNRIEMLPSKIKFVKVEFDKREIKKILKEIKIIKKELKK